MQDKKSLYQIEAEINDIEIAIDSYAEKFSGVIPEKLLEALNNVELERDDKLENIYKLMKNNQAEIEMFKNEEKALKERRQKLERKNEYLESLVVHSIGVGNKFKHNLAEFGWRKSKQVKVTDLAKVPAGLCEFVKKPKLIEIKKHLDELMIAGLPCEFAEFEEYQNLQVK